ncbi:hypothetical protein DFH09DRAFT_1102357 [Mycena vulgaris]|nr:hypothetical protein DFH09DRAFT_1102357 [Mycena vulgaris]
MISGISSRPWMKRVKFPRKVCAIFPSTNQGVEGTHTISFGVGPAPEPELSSAREFAPHERDTRRDNVLEHLIGGSTFADDADDCTRTSQCGSPRPSRGTDLRLDGQLVNALDGQEMGGKKGRAGSIHMMSSKGLTLDSLRLL